MDTFKFFFESLEAKDFVTLAGILLTFIVGVCGVIIGIRSNKKTIFVNAVTTERVKWMADLKQLLSEYLSLISYYEDKPFYEGAEKVTFFERLLYLQNKIKLHLNYEDSTDEEINQLIDKINIKIFGLYESKKVLVLPANKRLESIPEEKMQKYIENVISKDPKGLSFEQIVKQKDPDVFINFINKVLIEINRDYRAKYGYQGRDELIGYTNDLVEKSRRYLKSEWEKVKDEAQKGRLKKKSWFDKLFQKIHKY